MPRSARDRVVAVALVLLCAGEAGGKSSFDRASALATSQAAIGRAIDNHRFLTSAGAILNLNDLPKRPLVISLIFTSCHHTCPMITRQLGQAVSMARETLGEDAFHVLTIGFDTANDSPERMRAYARERGIDTSKWHFLSTDEATIGHLAQELGFLFFASPRGFDHLAQVTVTDAERRVYHQIYGDSFSPPALTEPLKRLALGIAAEQGSVASLFERVRLLCTVYDPRSGKYRLDYSLFVMLGTGLTGLLAIAIFIVRAWRENSERDCSS